MGIINSFLENDVQCSGTTIILDVGAGSSTKRASEICSNSMIIAIDVDPTKLIDLKVLTNINPILASAHAMPLRSSSVDAALMVLTLHELPKNIVDSVLKELHCILKSSSYMLFIDKLLATNPRNPSEVLPYLIEVAYHEALKHYLRLNHRALLPRTMEQYLETISRNFTIVRMNVIKFPWINGEEF